MLRSSCLLCPLIRNVGLMADKEAHELARSLFLVPPTRENLMRQQKDARARPTVARIALQLRYEQNSNVVSLGKARKAYMLSVRDMPGMSRVRLVLVQPYSSSLVMGVATNTHTN